MKYKERCCLDIRACEDTAVKHKQRISETSMSCSQSFRLCWCINCFKTESVLYESRPYVHVHRNLMIKYSLDLVNLICWHIILFACAFCFLRASLCRCGIICWVFTCVSQRDVWIHYGIMCDKCVYTLWTVQELVADICCWEEMFECCEFSA